MDDQQLQDLRARLPAFADGQAPAAELLEFCEFYGMNFGAREGVEYRAGTLSSGAYTVMVHQWLQADATANLVVLHGYFDHTGLFSRLIEYGLDRACNVLCFDLPGHGLSSGEPAVINDFAEYSTALQDVLAEVTQPSCLPLWAMAQSTGCAALVDFARKHPWPFERTVLLAPLVRPAAWNRIRLGNRLLTPFTDSISRHFNQNSSDQGFLEFIQKDPLQARRVSLRWISALREWLADLPVADLGVGPVLVIQGDEDGTVDWRYNLPVVGRLFPDSRVHFVAGAGHQLANESLQLRQRYLALVDAYLNDSPAPGP